MFYLICYDIASPRRLYRVRKLLLGYKVGGQKSFYECWLTAGELAALQQAWLRELVLAEDRVHFFQLDPRMTPLFLGTARRQSVQPFLIV